MDIARTLKFGLLGFSALMLVGCAHPDLIDLGTPEVAVVNELGVPDSKMTHSDGSFTLVYSMQPFGNRQRKNDE